MDLSPARWIWLPSQRTLACTFVLFRREVLCDGPPARATGWITADSRYRLTVNGQRVQWGPAPCDPRHYDVDPADLTPFLRAGPNVIGVEVLFYGVGEGTWAGGKPGLICRFELEHADGQTEQIVSDERWQCCVDRAHPPGHYKRWFLRALQETFDARRHPFSWDTPTYSPDERWIAAAPLRGRSDKPTICTGYPEYLGSDAASPALCDLRPREIPHLVEHELPALRLAESGRVLWRRDVDDWFEFRTPGSFELVRENVAVEQGAGAWQLSLGDDEERETKEEAAAGRSSFVVRPSSAFLTFEFAEQVVGWPFFTIDAPEGTVVELITQESHDPARTGWLDTHMFTWARFVCRAGVNRFETFDYESLRWLQLHIHRPTADDRRSTTDPQNQAVGGPRSVVVSGVGVRRRRFPWPNQPHIRCDEPDLQRLFDAAINTLHNSAQETCVDGMGRERQQYSGDGGHQLVAVRYAFGETRLPRRFLRTFSEGITVDGFFLDCWPAYDRLARLMQRQTNTAWWGPLLDHGVGFNFDCFQHYVDTGDLDALREPYPRLLRFAEYLAGLRRDHGLLPVERLGVPAVWIDHDAFRQQRHKQCAFNLYAAAMFERALAPICRAFGDDQAAERWAGLGRELRDAAVARFWSAEQGLFVNNLPWIDEDGGPRLCDRSLATAVLFQQCPQNNVVAGLEALAACPAEMGLSYPANAVWRYQALARHGRASVVLDDLRERWATMRSVLENNTIQEIWRAQPDSADQWSHCAVAPLQVLFAEIAGIRAAAPGFERCVVAPQLGDLGALELTAWTARGPIRFSAARADGRHHVAVALPPGCEAELIASPDTDIVLE